MVSGHEFETHHNFMTFCFVSRSLSFSSRATPSSTRAKSSFPRNSCRPHYPGNSSEKLWGYLGTTLATKLGAALKPGALPPSSHSYSARDRRGEALPAQTRAARTEGKPRTLFPEPPAARPHTPRAGAPSPSPGSSR